MLHNAIRLCSIRATYVFQCVSSPSLTSVLIATYISGLLEICPSTFCSSSCSDYLENSIFPEIRLNAARKILPLTDIFWTVCLRGLAMTDIDGSMRVERWASLSFVIWVPILALLSVGSPLLADVPGKTLLGICRDIWVVDGRGADIFLLPDICFLDEQISTTLGVVKVFKRKLISGHWRGNKLWIWGKSYWCIEYLRRKCLCSWVVSRTLHCRWLHCVPHISSSPLHHFHHSMWLSSPPRPRQTSPEFFPSVGQEQWRHQRRTDHRLLSGEKKVDRETRDGYCLDDRGHSSSWPRCYCCPGSFRSSCFHSEACFHKCRPRCTDLLRSSTAPLGCNHHPVCPGLQRSEGQ